MANNWKAEIHRQLMLSKEVGKIDSTLEEAIIHTIENGLDDVIYFLKTAPSVDLKTDAIPTKEFIDAWRIGYLAGMDGSVEVIKQFKESDG